MKLEVEAALTANRARLSCAVRMEGGDGGGGGEEGRRGGGGGREGGMRGDVVGISPN